MEGVDQEQLQQMMEQMGQQMGGTPGSFTHFSSILTTHESQVTMVMGH